MKSITLRNLPPEVLRLIEQVAQEKRMSVNKAVISLLEEGNSASRRKIVHHDLDDLAGSWSPEEAASFDEILELQRAVDEELWR